MIDTPEITQVPAVETAIIHLTIPRERIGEVMGPAIGELMGTIAAQGVKPAGAVYSHHLRMDPATFDFEVGVPVGSPVPMTPTTTAPPFVPTTPQTYVPTTPQPYVPTTPVVPTAPITPEAPYGQPSIRY